MATYYADFDLATGGNTGVDWTNAWKTMADAIAGSNGTIPAAGDTILCRGTDTLAATCTNALSGNETAGGGLIKWIGVDASGNNVGGTTRAILTGGAYATLTQNGSYNLYENFGFTGSSNNDGVEGSGDNNVYINCAFYGNNQNGYNGSGMVRCIHIRCTAYQNATGMSPGQNDRLLFCSIHDNTGAGIYDGSGGISDYIGCLIYDNGGRGIEALQSDSLVFNCVIDKNHGDAIQYYNGTSYSVPLIGCRITNAPAGKYGIEMSTRDVIWGWNYLGGNDTDTNNATLAYAVLHNGAATNTTGGSDTNHGYTTTTDGSEDYNLRSDATIRRTAILIPTS